MKIVNRIMRSMFIACGFMMMFCVEVQAVSIPFFNFGAQSIPTIKYQVHVQDEGWMDTVSNGAMAGTTGQSKRVEAIKLTLKNNSKSMIKYRTHVQDIGWQDWVGSGEVAGTTGQSKAVEAIQIKLTSSYAKKYDIYYRVHVKNKGWLGWAKNGQTAGSEGLALRVEAIEIRLMTKGSLFDTSGSAVLTKPTLTYQVHIQDSGWLESVNEANIAGTTGQSKRLEAIKIYLRDFDGANGIKYRAHVSNIGWQDYKSSGEVMGSTGKGNAIEAVQIELAESLKNYFDIWYRVYVKDIGWLDWVSNGEVAGTTGRGLPTEALEMKLINKKEDKMLGINWSHIARVGNQAVGSDSCGCFAMAYSKTIIDGTVHYWNEFNANGGNNQYNACANWSVAGYQLTYCASEKELYKKAYESINNNRPFVVWVKGARSQTHYITIVGYQKISSIETLSAYNFLIIDSCSGTTKACAENMGEVGYFLNKVEGAGYQYIY